MRTIIHAILMLAVLIQPLPAVRACSTPSCAPSTTPSCCCCTGEQAVCACEPTSKPVPTAPAQELRPDIDLFPALPPTLLPCVQIARSTPVVPNRVAMWGGFPSIQSLLCVWRT